MSLPRTNTVALLIALFVTVCGARVATADDTPQALPVTQSWTTATLITANDNWSDDAPSACFDGSATRIHAVQGSGTASPLVGTTVTVEGVVVGDFQGSSSLRGFFVQEEDAETDANPATSEGLFVFDTAAIDVAAGQTVRVTGVVTEFDNLTELTDLVHVDLCGADGTVTPQPVTLPVDDAGAWERYEGMLVAFPQELTVTENFNLGRFGELLLAGGGRLFQPTQIAAPGDEAALIAAANARNRILLDDADTQQNRDPIVYPTPGGLSAASTVRLGDRVNGLSGIVDERFESYRIQPTALTFVAANPRPAAPTRGISETTVVAANLLNYFVTLDTGTPSCGPTGALDCRGANNAAEFARQRAKTIAALAALDADIVGVTEVENSADDRALADLVDGLNAGVGAGTYAHLPTGAIGADAIRVGILYKPAAVTPRGVFALLTTEVDPNFLDSKNRPVLAQTFVTPAGDRFTIAVAHLKSKSDDCDDVGDPDEGDGQGSCNLTRSNAAKALATWLESDPTGSEETDFLIVGDLNSFAQEDPITALKSAGYTDLVASYGGAAAYSYVFDGQSGYLDHALASENMAPQVAGVAEWHINTDEPRALDYNTEFKSAGQVTSLFAADAYRAADHDPLIVRLCFNHCASAASLYLPAISR